jgi:hypothetical protein
MPAVMATKGWTELVKNPGLVKKLVKNPIDLLLMKSKI